MLNWGGWGWGGELGVVVKCNMLVNLTFHLPPPGSLSKTHPKAKIEFKCPFPSARFDGQLFGET